MSLVRLERDRSPIYSGRALPDEVTLRLTFVRLLRYVGISATPQPTHHFKSSKQLERTAVAESYGGRRATARP